MWFDDRRGGPEAQAGVRLPASEAEAGRADRSCCVPPELIARAAEQGIDAGGAALQQHLAACPECRRALAEVVLDRLPGEPPAIQPLEAEPFWQRWLPQLRPAPLAAAVLLFLLGAGAFAAPLLLALLRPQPADSVQLEPGGAVLPLPTSGSTVLEGRSAPPAAPEQVAARPPDSSNPAPPAPPAPVRPAPLQEEARLVATPAAAAAPAAADAPLRTPGRPNVEELKAERAREAAEQLFVEGVVHYQARRFADATRTFDRLLVMAPDAQLAAMASRWRARSAAEERGECLPGYVRRIHVVPPGEATEGSGRQGATEYIECVLPE